MNRMKRSQPDATDVVELPAVAFNCLLSSWGSGVLDWDEGGELELVDWNEGGVLELVDWA